MHVSLPVRSVPFLALGLAGFAGPVLAQSYRLNAPFELESTVGDVRDFAVKANGNFVFFKADARLPGVVELFTVPALGGVAPFRENRYLKADREVLLHEPSPVGNWVVFVADQDADEVFELYSRSPGDNNPRKLSGALVTGGDVDSFAITNDGARVVYHADQDSDEVFELYSVPIDASASAVKISGAMVGGGDVIGGQTFRGFLVSPSSSRVVYIANQQTVDVFELYSAPIDGSASPVKLNGPLPTGGDVFRVPELPVAISADGGTVVYRADQDVNELFELFRVPIDGSASPTQVHPPLVSGGDVGTFALGPDGQRVVYEADQDVNGLQEVFSAPLDGSAAAVKLNVPGQNTDFMAFSPDSSLVVLATIQPELQSVASDGSSVPVVLDVLASPKEFMDVAVSPDSSRVVYRTGDRECLGGSCFNVDTLRSVPLDGSASPVRLDPESGTFDVTNAGQRGVPFAISSDSARVVYNWGAGPTEATGWSLHSVPIDRSTAPVTVASGVVSRSYALNPAGTRVFFMADLGAGSVFELYSASALNGAARVKLSGALARGTAADVSLPSFPSWQAFRMDPAGSRVVYSADANIDGTFQLFATPAAGNAPVVTLTDHGISGTSFLISPDGERVVYTRSDPLLGGIYSVPADGGTAPVRLNDPLGAGEVVADFQISADGSRVVYRVSSRLHSAPIGGGASPITLESGGNVTSFSVSPITNRAVYILSRPGGLSLHSVPVDGSQPPVELQGQPGSPTFFDVTATGTHVVYHASGAIYSIPIDGSASRILLSGTVNRFHAQVLLSPDSTWVVFSGWESATPDVSELFRVRVDGSFGPAKLNGALVAGGDVLLHAGNPAAAISPDSSRVVYVADQQSDEVFELFSVPLDGSASPVRLNGALVSGGDVLSTSSTRMENVRFSPDGARVVYAADQESDEVLELYSVPADGSASSVKLNGALVAGGDYSSAFPFQVSPDSGLVVYAADQEADDLVELYLASIDGSRSPVKLHWPLAQNGVAAFALTSDSTRVVFQATERSQVTELFASRLTFDTTHGRVQRR